MSPARRKAAEPKGEAAPIVVPASPGLDDATTLTAELKALPADAAITFDASGVETMTTPYVLTIVSLVQNRPETAEQVRVNAPTAAFVDAFSDLGLFQDLMKMEFTT